ncbi:MAG: glycoside hydrolase family 3 C-terminal domain-containing protein, partial [Alistipes sp.]|nr:glycoside hydrolase family 3 C-terminal domain-containing protein [Alistipes sp.]
LLCVIPACPHPPPGAAPRARPVVTVIMAGRPLTVKRDLGNMDALLYSFHPGTMGGPAIADILFGKVSPSGKLPATFPVAAGQIPMHYNRNMTGRPASGTEVLLDDIVPGAGQTSLGCSSYMLDTGFAPLFPFGYGLSYTTFEYSRPELDAESYSADGTIRAACTLRNSGSRDAEEVVQLYVRDMVGSVTRPIKELKAFRRVAVPAGETVRVEIELPVAELAFWNIDMERTVEPGEFRLWMAGDSDSGEYATFHVK